MLNFVFPITSIVECVHTQHRLDDKHIHYICSSVAKGTSFWGRGALSRHHSTSIDFFHTCISPKVFAPPVTKARGDL